MRITMIMGNTPKVDAEWSRPLPSESAGRTKVAEHVYEPQLRLGQADFSRGVRRR